MRKPSDCSARRSLAPALWVALVLATGGAPALAADAPALAVPKGVQAVLAAHCAGRHGDRGEGNVDVTTLDKLKPGDRLLTSDEYFVHHNMDTTAGKGDRRPVEAGVRHARFGLDQTGAIKQFLG